MLSITHIFPYLEAVVEGQLSSNDALDIKPKLDNLRSKIGDKRLYLAVVGEFSSGKSTFINALLGFRLLKDAVMPTTACATYIQNAGTALSLNVQFFDGNKFQATEHNISSVATYLRRTHHIETHSMQEVVDVLTSHNKVARLVKSLSINVPNAKIPQNIVIIDTPGFNPGSASTDNHYEITQHVVEHVADAALILTPCEQAMSATLIRFLREKLHRCLHRCIYIVTRFDTMDEWSRNGVEEYARNRIISDLGINNPRFYAESAITMLPVKRIPDERKSDWAMFQREFKRFETETWRELQRSKDIMLHEHIGLLTHEMAQLCQSRLQRKVGELRNMAAFLDTIRIENITTVCNEMVAQSINALDCALQSFDSSLHGATSRCIAKAESMIMDTKYSTSNFEKVLIPEIIEAVNHEANMRLTEISATLSNRVRICVHGQISIMQRIFSSHYDKFPALRPQERLPNTDLVRIDTPYLSFSAAIQETKSLDKKENISMLGGAAAAGIIGSLLLGPIGLLAMVGGAMLGSKDKQIRERAVELVSPEISKYFAMLAIRLRDEIQRTKAQYRGLIQRFANDHIDKYGQAVSAMIRQHEEKKRLINNQIKGLNTTIANLGNIQGDIEHELAVLKYKH